MRPRKLIAQLQPATFRPPRYCEDCGKSLISNLHVLEDHYYCTNCYLKKQQPESDTQTAPESSKST